MKVILVLGVLTLLGVSCNSTVDNKVIDTNLSEDITKVIKCFGNTQGTTYSVIVNDDIELERREIDETLHSFDLALSSYIPNSTLSKLNNFPAGTFKYKDSLEFFNRCIKESRLVY